MCQAYTNSICQQHASKGTSYETDQGSRGPWPPDEDDGATNAEINRELAAIKRAFSLGIQSGKVLMKPHIPMLKENNVREGFFERDRPDAPLETPRVETPRVVASTPDFRVHYWLANPERGEEP